MSIRSALCTVLAALCAGSVAMAKPDDPVLVLANATVIDGRSAEPQSGMHVIVRRGRIEAVTSDRRRSDDSGGRVIDLEGRFLLPGLIDAHLHLYDLASARTALRSGVTTARSMGVPHFADVGIRNLHRAGLADVPDILPAGYHIRRRLADAFFLDFPELSRLMQGVGTTADVRKLVQINSVRGAAVIKVLATERAGDPRQEMLVRDLSDAQLRAAVSAASARGLTVAAHAHSDEGVRAAVLAGVRTIEHGTLASEASLDLMKERGVCLVPTLSFWSDMSEPGGEYDHPVLAERARTMLPRVRETTARAATKGVRIAAGSDMRYNAPPNGRTVADEVADLVESGLSPMAAIQSATSVAAECLGIADRTGAIEAGREADLIVVDADPTKAAAALKQLRLVVNDGIVAIDALSR